MRIMVLISVYNYSKILYNLIKFYNESLHEAYVLVINDGDSIGDLVSGGNFKELNFAVLQNPEKHRGDLRYIYSSYFNPDSYDCIIINEHDVMPNESSLYACQEAFDKYKDDKLASVSCMYQWQNKLCYPAHKNWTMEHPFMNNHLGSLVKVGAQGVPFGFSLWNPNALKLINHSVLPKLWKLDSDFGVFLKSIDYYHIRLKSYSVEHMNGGISSWK